MGESRREKYKLNKYGWTEIWLDWGDYDNKTTRRSKAAQEWL
jgi:hypothetical protein